MTQPAGQGAPRSSSASATARRSSFTAHEINVAEAAGRREGLPQVAARASSTGRSSTSATSATGWSQKNQKQYLGQQVAAVEAGPRAAGEPLRQAGHGHHAAPEGRGRICSRPRWPAATPASSSSGSTTRPSSRSRWTARRYYFVADAVTRQAGRQGERRVLRLAAAVPRQAAAVRGPHQAVRRVHRRRRPGDPRARPAAAATTSGSSPPRTPAGPLRLPRLHRRLVRPATTTPSTTQTKVFTITDRPVYRPEQTVKFKFWVRHAKYDQEDTSDFAGQTFTVEIHNPKGEKVFEKSVTADAYGGLEGEFDAAGRRHARASTGCSVAEPQLRRRQLPRRGVQEAGVRGHGRGPRRSR